MEVLRNIGRLLVCPAGGGQGGIGAIEKAALAWCDGRVEWVGSESDLPESFHDAASSDALGRLVVPGLIDCHTHLAFAGSRADEFEARILGESYLQIARAGGGIRSTVRATREASFEDLMEDTREDLAAMAALGVTTVEAKSGYGLSTESELRLLDVYRKVAEIQSVRLVSTFLGAHVVAPEYDDDHDGYVSLVCEEMLPQVAERGLARYCDVFVEEGAFSAADAERILGCARRLGLGGKLHVDQLHDQGGGALAARTGCISADHLEHISEEGIAAMADAGVVAVSLPLAAFFLRQPAMPARRLIEAGAAVAVATDYNPGSAPSYHLPLALLLACVTQGMTAAEAIKGATRFAARAIGLEDEIGSLERGKAADFAIVDAPHERDWIYHFSANAVVETVIGGRTVFRRAD